jgi:hypothetical protein
MGDMRNACRIFVGNLKVRGLLGDTEVTGRIILKCVARNRM